jgi:hypothetical protein
MYKMCNGVTQLRLERPKRRPMMVDNCVAESVYEDVTTLGCSK